MFVECCLCSAYLIEVTLAGSYSPCLDTLTAALAVCQVVFADPKTSHHMPPLWHHQASTLLHLRDRHQYMNSTTNQVSIETHEPIKSTLLIYTAAPDDHCLVSRHIAHASRTTWSSPSRIIHLGLHTRVHSNVLRKRQLLVKAGCRTAAVDMKTRLDDRMALSMRNSALERSSMDGPVEDCIHQSRSGYTVAKT